MGYQIEAFLQDGQPALKIYDIDSRQLCLSWQCPSSVSRNDNKEMQQLFRQLLLLTCRQELSNVRLFRLNNQQTPVLD